MPRLDAAATVAFAALSLLAVWPPKAQRPFGLSELHQHQHQHQLTKALPSYRWIVTVGAIVWASWASVPFIGGSVAPERRALAVYPLLLLYTSVAWFALIK